MPTDNFDLRSGVSYCGMLPEGVYMLFWCCGVFIPVACRRSNFRLRFGIRAYGFGGMPLCLFLCRGSRLPTQRCLLQAVWQRVKEDSRHSNMEWSKFLTKKNTAGEASWRSIKKPTGGTTPRSAANAGSTLGLCQAPPAEELRKRIPALPALWKQRPTPLITFPLETGSPYSLTKKNKKTKSMIRGFFVRARIPGAYPHRSPVLLLLVVQLSGF